jgi:hypothetical protein
LANAVAEYDSELQDVEDNFISRIDRQQDVSDAFDENEPTALACAHLVITNGDDDDDDDFVVVNETNGVLTVNNDNKIQLLDSPDGESPIERNVVTGNNNFLLISLKCLLRVQM